jgi:hypothetical protein
MKSGGDGSATWFFSSATAYRHGVATAGAMLTCVAVALSVPPFTSPKKMDAFAEGRTSRAVAQQSLELSAPLPEVVTVPKLQEAPTDVADNSARPVIESPFFADARTSRKVAQQSHEPSAPLPEVVSLPKLVESPTEVANNSVVPLIKSPLNVQTPAPALKPAQLTTDGDEGVASFVGVWAPDAGTCSARNLRDGVLPAVISTDGAWAGETFCMFTNKKQTEAGWNVVAMCSNPRERWTANVRLAVKDNRLTWTSKRGAQAYTRCAPDVLMAVAR